MVVAAAAVGEWSVAAAVVVVASFVAAAAVVVENGFEVMVMAVVAIAWLNHFQS